MIFVYFSVETSGTSCQKLFLAAALAACSSSQYHVLVVLVPELLSEFAFFLGSLEFLKLP